MPTAILDAVRRVRSIRQAAAGRPLTDAQRRDYDGAMTQIRIAADNVPDPNLGSSRLKSKALALINGAGAEGRDMSDGELASAVGFLEAAKDQEELEARSARIAADPYAQRVREGIMPSIEIIRNESVYRPDGEHSFLRDVLGAAKGDWPAAERLNRSNQTEAERERRDGTTGSTSMGSYIPPRWIVDEYAAVARTGRVLANTIRLIGEPQSNTETIPRATTGVSVAGQAGDNAAVSETDQVTAQIARSTVTIAGQQDVSIQSVELPNARMVDQILTGDLIAAYQAELDRQILRGSGTNELLGINQISGINAVSYTDVTPTVPELYPKVADAIQQIATNRKLPPTAVAMHPRRWAWIGAALDSQTRPLVVPGTGGMNGIAQFSSPNAEGAVGSIIGIPIYTTTSVATTLGGGTEDQIVIYRGADILLLESPIRVRVLQETLSGNLTVRFQLYAFANLFAGRYPSAISTIGSTGLIAPTF